MNILEGWEISDFPGDILRHGSYSNPFLHNIEELQIKQSNMGHEISKI